MRETISLIVLWGVAPAIFVALLIFGMIIVRHTSYMPGRLFRLSADRQGIMECWNSACLSADREYWVIMNKNNWDKV